MPSASAFDRHFSPEEQANLAAWLDRNPHMTVDAFRELLAERGLDVARSTAGATKKRVEQLGLRMRESRVSMDAITESLEGADDSQRSRALIEMGRTLLFEFQAAAIARGEPLDSREVRETSESIERLMKAARQNQLAGEAARAESYAALARAVDEIEAGEAEVAEGTKDPREVLRRVREEVYGIIDA